MDEEEEYSTEEYLEIVGFNRAMFEVRLNALNAEFDDLVVQVKVDRELVEKEKADEVHQERMKQHLDLLDKYRDLFVALAEAHPADYIDISSATERQKQYNDLFGFD